MKLSETEILQEIQAGNQTVFEQVFHQYYAVLCRFSLQYLPDPEDAREVVQELFLTLWEKREQVEISSSLKSYLYQSTRNKCLNHLKHLKVRDNYADHAKAFFARSSEGDAASYAELEGRVTQVIAGLPERCREIFELSRYEGLKYREIADLLHISPKTVEVQMVKALKTLREQLKDYLVVVLILTEWFNGY